MPNVIPTTDNLPIIQIEYNVVVTVWISFPHLNAEVSIPIRIGTIPLDLLYQN